MRRLSLAGCLIPGPVSRKSLRPTRADGVSRREWLLAHSFLAQDLGAQGLYPVLKHRMGWPKLSTIAAVAPNPHVWLHQAPGTVKSPDVIRFVRYLLRTTSRPIMLFWDGLGAHWSERTRCALRAYRHRLTVHRLPAYAPELNPAEGLYAYLKGHVLRGHCPPDSEAQQRAIRRAVAQVRCRPTLIRPFFRRTPLSS